MNNLEREAENDSQERERERGKGNRRKNQRLEVHEPRRTRHFDPRTSKVSKCLNSVRKVSKLIADIDDLDVSQQEWTQSLSLSLSMGVGMGMGIITIGILMGTTGSTPKRVGAGRVRGVERRTSPTSSSTTTGSDGASGERGTTGTDST